MTIEIDLRHVRDPLEMDRELVRIAKFFGCPSSLDEARARRDRIEGQVRTHCARLGISRHADRCVNVAMDLWNKGTVSAAICVERANLVADRIAAECDPQPPLAA